MRCLGLVPVVLASVTKYELEAYSSAADPKAIVHADHARFTVLTPSLIRMESSARGEFEDRPSLAFVNRNVSVPDFNVTNQSNVFTIETSTLKLTFDAKLPFAKGNPSVVSRAKEGTTEYFQPWEFGMTSDQDGGNLMGTFRTLDGTPAVPLNCTQNQKDHCEWGLISRTGWALVNETGGPVLDDDDWWADENGTMLRNKADADYYLFAHGLNYKQALADLVSVGGKIPVFPRYSSGVWYTRWFDFTSQDVRKSVEDYATRGLPLDVLVLDMNWHRKNDWTGYSWDEHLFPFPEVMLAWLKSKGLHMAANLHDANGVNAWEDKFPEICKAMGLDPNVTTTVNFTLTNKTYVNALEDLVLQPVEKQGMDFWWIDWQQGETGGNTGQDGPLNKMNPTIWTDKMRVTNPIRRCKQQRECTNKRGVVLARFGGLGNHRYQHGFSGDVKGVVWSSLAYQPYFTMTAGNVGFGFWSHDIVGPADDEELYLRWVQWASWSPIMRSHDRGMSAGGCGNQDWPTTWGADECPIVQPHKASMLYFEALRSVLLTRSALIPYIYTQTRVAHDTGVSIVRPMYFDHPMEDLAYAADMDGNFAQYMFGEDIMVAPVVTPVATDRQLAVQTLWMPPGQWFELETGSLIEGGQVVTHEVDRTEVPVFMKAGAVIPRIPMKMGNTLGRAAQQYEALEWTIYPGSSTGSFRLYEDDGASYGYLNHEFAWTTGNYTRTNTSLTFQVATEGAYDALPKSRQTVLRIANVGPPEEVQAGAMKLNFSDWGSEAPSWSYDGVSLELVVNAGNATDISVTFAHPNTDFNGVKGLFRRATLAKRAMDELRRTLGAQTPQPAYLSRVSSMADFLSHAAGTNTTGFWAMLKEVPSLFDKAIATVPAAPGRAAYANALLTSANGVVPSLAAVAPGLALV